MTCQSMSHALFFCKYIENSQLSTLLLWSFCMWNLYPVFLNCLLSLCLLKPAFSWEYCNGYVTKIFRFSRQNSKIMGFRNLWTDWIFQTWGIYAYLCIHTTTIEVCSTAPSSRSLCWIYSFYVTISHLLYLFIWREEWKEVIEWFWLFFFF